ncbi:hypothetical protein BKA57DRAFT_450197 [Linnemannia elongata]|nr:hypothetical protein BKA57DRAFT_450197 [Linnemannia elongata]
MPKRLTLAPAFHTRFLAQNLNSAVMTKISTFVAVASIFAASVVLACELPCVVNLAQSDGNRCIYDCHADQVRSAQQNAADFGGDLRQKRFSCYSNGGQVICQRTGNFGGCGDHLWKTGRDC